MLTLEIIMNAVSIPAVDLADLKSFNTVHVRLSEPIEKLGGRNHTFRQMRIERAGRDILCLANYVSSELFRFPLAGKRFRHSGKRTFAGLRPYIVE